MNENWLISNYSEPRNIAFDENYTYAYVANFNGGSITQIKLAEDITLPPISVNPTFITGLLLPSCVVFDKNYKYLYVVNRGTNTIIQVTIDKINPENTPVINSEWINTNLNAPCYMAFDSSNTYAYISNVGNNTTPTVNNYISLFKLDNTMIPNLINDKWYDSGVQNVPVKILFDPTYKYLYVTNNGNLFSNPSVPGYITQFTLDENPESPPSNINNEWVKDIFCQFLIFDNTNNYAYLTDLRNIIQIKLDANNNPINLNLNWVINDEGPCDMAFDVTYKKLYVCNNNNFTISIVTLNNDNVENPPTINPNWSIGGLIIPSGIVFDNTSNYAYASNLNSGTISQILLNNDDNPIVINSKFVTGLNSPNDIAYDNNNNCLYVINNGVNNGTISKIFLNNDNPLEPPNVILDWADVQSNPWCIIIDNNNTYAYVSNVNSNTISRIYLKSEPPIVENNWVTGLNGPTGMSFDNTNENIYVTMINDNTISLITLSETPIVTSWFTGFNTLNNTSGLAYIVIDSTHAYVGNYYTNIISQMLLNVPSITNLNFINDNTDGLEGLNIHNNYLYISNAYNSCISQYTLDDSLIGCFLANSKVLTKDGLISIKLLKKGDLVQTFNHGLLPVKFVGKNTFFNRLTEEKINAHLYKLNKNNFPELTEDLFITGGHPLLVDEKDLDEETKKKLLDMDISIITEGKYRVFAMLHPKSELWNEEGYHDIYDIVLENDDPYKNYGIWVNGLLTESMDEDFFLNYSGMTEINK
jgi:DNA-binding beta-propeller fold protein YncE